MIHIAVVVEPYDRLILGGRKTIECRLTQQPREPFGVITPGERIWFKRSAGPFFAVAVVDRVWTTDNLTPELLSQLRRQFDKQIHGSDEYWSARRDCRYATLIWLREVTPTTSHPRYKPQNMRAWYTLPDSAAPSPSPAIAGEGRGEGVIDRPASGKLKVPDRLIPAAVKSARGTFTIALTAGAIKNRYVRLGQHRQHFADGTITLKLKDGPTVTTDILDRSGMFRFRGWGPWFEQHGLAAGDHLRFTADGPRSFCVAAVRAGASRG
jgi:hypothetical protein